MAPRGLLLTGLASFEGSLATCFCCSCCCYPSSPPGIPSQLLSDFRPYFFPTRRVCLICSCPVGELLPFPYATGAMPPFGVHRAGDHSPTSAAWNRRTHRHCITLKEQPGDTFKGPDDNEYANGISIGCLCYLQKLCVMSFLDSKLPLKSTGDLG